MIKRFDVMSSSYVERETNYFNPKYIYFLNTLICLILLLQIKNNVIYVTLTYPYQTRRYYK